LKQSNTEEESFYPLSLPGIKLYGIEKWLDEFKPILPGSEFQKGYELIFDVFASLVNCQNRDSALYWSGAVNYKAPMLLAESYFRYLCLCKLKKQGISKVFLQKEIEIDAAISDTVDATFTDEQRYSISEKERLLERLRLMKLNFKSYGVKKAVTSLFPDYQCALITDPESKDVKRFVNENRMAPQCLRPSVFLPAKAYIDSLNEEPAKEAIQFVKDFFEKVSAEDQNFKSFFNKRLQKKMTDMFSKTIRVLDYFNNTLKKNRLGTLLVQSVTSPESRMLAAAWKRLNGETIGFCHGNGYLTSYGGSDVNNGTHLVVDKYIVSCGGEKILTDFIREKMQSKFSRNDEIIALQTPYYRELFESMQGDPEVKEIKKIMFVGYPMDYHFDPYLVEHNTISYTHLVLRIMKVLRKAGYYIQYKDHPDTLSQTDGFFEEYADEVITTNFDKVYKEADCFFFITPYTTTFGYSAMTKIPMVYVNNLNFNFWQPDLKKLLDKRAVAFDVTSAGDGVLQFSDDDLLTSVEKSLKQVNHEVVKQFAF